MDSIQIAHVTLSGKDDGPFPACQVSVYGVAADAVVLWPYGMHGGLPVDSYAISFPINGQQENRMVMGYRPDLRMKDKKPGEMQFGNFLRGSTIFYDDDGNIVVNCENDETVTIKGAAVVNITGDADITVGGETTLTTSKLTVDGDLTVTGDTALGSTVTSGAKNISDTHTHGGVTTGPGTSGPPV